MKLGRWLASSGLVLTLGVASPPARAQEESSPSIELGSSRIGGPGAGARDRRRVKSWDAPDEYVTEETLPDKGSRKRIPSLHELAERHYGGQQWKEACRFYGMIIEEGGEDALEAKDGGKAKAARSYFGCAEDAFSSDDFDAVEKNLTRAEQLGLGGARHDVLRRKVVREQYQAKLGKGDIEGAYVLYQRYQEMGEPDEDERIWYGEQLALNAKRAHELKDDITFREIMSKLEQVSPMNRTYRELREASEGGAELFSNLLLVLGSAVAAVGLLSLLSRWRARARVGSIGGGGRSNPYLDDDDL